MHPDGNGQSTPAYFRQAAIDARARESFGTVERNRNLGWIIVGLFVAVLIAAALFVTSAHYARRESASGQLVPAEGSVRLAAPISGVVKRLPVREGQFVKQGQPVVVIAADRVLRGGQQVDESLRILQESRLAALQRQSRARADQIGEQIQELEQRRRGLLRDIGRCDDLAAILRKRLSLQRETYKAQRGLADVGMISTAALRQHEDAVLGIQLQVQQALRDKAAQQSQIEQIAHQLARLHAEAELASSETQTARDELRERQISSDAQSASTLIAPIAGFVTALTVHEGSTLSDGQAIAVIVPAADEHREVPLEAEIWAPSRAVGFVRPGTKVRLMYDAFPYQTFGTDAGTVIEVARSPLLPRDIPVPVEAREALFRIRVGLDRRSLRFAKDAGSLSPGMRLTADLILEERSLLDIFLEPVHAVARRAAN
jgi:membrane fusion protein